MLSGLQTGWPPRSVGVMVGPGVVRGWCVEDSCIRSRVSVVGGGTAFPC